MKIEEQIEAYLASQAEPKRSDMRTLDQLILQSSPACKLWFSDGRDNSGKVVANPNIGYGTYVIKYADGTTREFYQIGLSANKSGISIYILGLEDKSFLATTFGKTIGKAAVSGYCIKFKRIEDINLDVLQAAIRYGFQAHRQ